MIEEMSCCEPRDVEQSLESQDGRERISLDGSDPLRVLGPGKLGSRPGS